MVSSKAIPSTIYCEFSPSHLRIALLTNGSIWNYWPGGGWRNDQKITPGWTTDTLDFGYVRPSTYSNGDIICHRKATPGALSVKLKAGDILHFQWTNWVPTHHGPMMHYMASTEGVDHQKVDKFKLKWNKIDEYGLIDPLHSWNTSANQPAGYWAADKLIIDGGRWDFQIPKKIAKGKYIVRAETVAVHSSLIKDGTQHYPQCINIEITEGGTDTLSGGVVGTELYNPSDPGIGNFDIFKTNPIMTKYPIPGPKVHECGQARWDQTPRPGSAPIWYGPSTGEEFGFKDGKTVGRIGVDPPNGGYYGNSDFTTDSLTTALTPNKTNSAVDPPPAATTTSTASNTEPGTSLSSHSNYLISLSSS